MSTWHPREAIVLAATLVCVAGCSSLGDEAGPAVPSPSPSGKTAKSCRALHDRLPEHVNGQERIALEPGSPYTAAWGDPAIELRCGVPRPAKLTPGSEHYNPTADAAEVNGISWLIEERDGGYRFTTTERAARVEVTVPDAYAPEVGALTDLATPLKRTAD
ncbi:DUF3515 domain-containing protein [Streptomyces sp. NPDC054796]